MTRISISGIHNNSNYPCLNFKNIRAVGKITPEIYAIQYDEMKIREVNCPWCILQHKSFDIPDCVACCA